MPFFSFVCNMALPCNGHSGWLSWLNFDYVWNLSSQLDAKMHFYHKMAKIGNLRPQRFCFQGNWEQHVKNFFKFLAEMCSATYFQVSDTIFIE